MRWTFYCDKKIGWFCVVVLLAACAAHTSANRALASNLISELQDLLVEQKNFNREIEKVGASASDLARQKSVLSNHPQYSSMLKKILQWKAKRLADPARAIYLDAQFLLVEMSEDETQVYLKRLELYEKSSDLYAATVNFQERDRQLNEHRRKLYLSIRDGLDSIVLIKMNQQFTVLSQEETAEVQRREGLIKNLTDDFVTLGDWGK